MKNISQLSTPLLCMLLLSCLWPSSVMSQEAPPALRIGFGYTGNAYRGDLTQESSAMWRAEPGANLSVNLDNLKKLRLQFNLGFGGFTEQADEPLPMAPEGIAPNEFVRTTFYYTDLRLQYRLFPDHAVTPYLSAGVGLFSFQPRDAAGNFLGENIFSRLPEEEYLTLIGSFPLSAGVEWKLNPILGIGLEYTYRLTGSDYLDNIGQLGTAPGADQLHVAQIKVMFSIGQGNTRPVARPSEPILQPVEVVEEVPSPPVYYRNRDGKLVRKR